MAMRQEFLTLWIRLGAVICQLHEYVIANGRVSRSLR